MPKKIVNNTNKGEETTEEDDPEEETTEKTHISDHQCLNRCCIQTHKSMKIGYSVLSLISNPPYLVTFFQSSLPRFS